jgi:hypothetical protein
MIRKVPGPNLSCPDDGPGHNIGVRSSEHNLRPKQTRCKLCDTMNMPCTTSVGLATHRYSSGQLAGYQLVHLGHGGSIPGSEPASNFAASCTRCLRSVPSTGSELDKPANQHVKPWRQCIRLQTRMTCNQVLFDPFRFDSIDRPGSLASASCRGGDDSHHLPILGVSSSHRPAFLFASVAQFSARPVHEGLRPTSACFPQ